MRKSIFDLISNQEIDVKREYIRIHKLFEEDFFHETYLDYTICEYIEYHFFNEWKERGRYLSINDMLISLNIRNDKGELVEYTLEKLLLYIEIILNLISISNIDSLGNGNIDFNVDTYFLLRDNIRDLLEDLNFEMRKKQDNRIIIAEKDAILSEVAETNPNIADKVIEYRRFMLKGKLEEKKGILKFLANDIEPLKSTFKGNTYSNLMDDVQFMLNNIDIRHNNKEGKYKKDYIANISNEELEELYDKTFDMILGIYVIDKYLNYKKGIDYLKKNIK